MKFRAQFTDPSDTTAAKPDQIFAENKAAIDQWVNKKLETAGPHAFVAIYESKEVLIEIRRPVPREAEAAKSS